MIKKKITAHSNNPSQENTQQSSSYSNSNPKPTFPVRQGLLVEMEAARGGGTKGRREEEKKWVGK